MKSYIKTILISILYFLYGCSIFTSTSYNGPELLIKKDFEGKNIAVVNFFTQGSFSTSNLGKIAADKLTDFLFLITQFDVVERAKINDALTELKINNTENLSDEQIRQLGSRVGAKYLVLGRILQFNEGEFLSSNSDKVINLSYRIISVETTEVVGIASMSCEYTTNTMERIEYMLNETVEEILDLE
ncbi:MAG: hypothetical protein JXA68_04815 [Ignavibacteriales bacterium]|nr:hypothetical protein [Ignavibacteriales bacterium]